MNYCCPRDKNRLHWYDFLSTGRWFCRACSGTLIYERGLQKLPRYSEFNQMLKPARPDKLLTCPICDQKMDRFELSHQRRLFEIDKCQACKCYWFDPGEVNQLLVSGEKSNSDLELSHFPIQEEYARQQLRMFRTIRYGIALIFAFIAFKNWQWVQAHHPNTQFKVMCIANKCTTWLDPFIFCSISSIFFVIGHPGLMMFGTVLGFIGTMIGLARL